MSTEFYLKKKTIEPFFDEVKEETFLFGQRACGWKFLFYTHGRDDLNNTNDFKKLLLDNKNHIYDEYGKKYNYDEMIDIIYKYQEGSYMDKDYEPKGHQKYEYLDEEGFRFYK